MNVEISKDTADVFTCPKRLIKASDGVKSLPDFPCSRGVQVKMKSDNTVPIVFAESDAALSGGNGMPLSAGEGFFFPVKNANMLKYKTASVSDQTFYTVIL